MTRQPADEAFRQYQSTGDPQALAVTFDATAPELLRLASHLVSDLNQAEDLVQATFLVAMKDAGSYDPTQPVLRWLLGILSNRVRRHQRAATKRPDLDRLPTREPVGPLQVAESTPIQVHDLAVAVPDVLATDIEVDIGRDQYALAPKI